MYNAAEDLIQRNLRDGRSEKIAFVDDNRTLTFRELEERSAAFAASLSTLGVEREQRVFLCMHDTVDFPVVFLGCIKAGAVPVPVNTLLTRHDYAYMIRDCGARAAVVSAALLPLIDSLRPEVPELRHVLIAGGDPAHADSLARRLDGGAARYRVAATVSDESCFWLYSSGSTGAPKGTVHVHSSLIQTAELYARPIVGITANDVCFSAAKMFFAYGLGNSLTFPLAAGATTVLMAERPTPAAVFARMAKHHPTIFYGVPTLYAGLLASPDLPQVLPGLRRCVSAGEPLPEDIGRRWQRRFGVDILDGLGSTEMLHIFISNRPGEVQYGTTGRAVPGYSIRLVDDHEQPVACGEPGELLVAGPTSALYYWNNRERSRNTFLGPWTRTGDQYIERSDGCLIYAGRKDDMLKVGGIYVSPPEVESALISHESVLEAAVVGRKDEDGLVKPAAYVVLRNGFTSSEALSALLKQHVKSRLAPYKYPRWIEYCDELPKTATGKIQRFKLRSGPASGHAAGPPAEPAARRMTIAGHSIEYRLTATAAGRTIVFLHEGLGSISLWKDFPQRLAAACGCNALVYSRYGNGLSDPLAEPRRPDYMHREALEVLPELLERLSVRDPILFGHSDGASIAIIHAAEHAAAGAILCAPHVFVEDLAVSSIRATKAAYESTGLRARLARHHADVDRTFWGWNDIWLHADFRRWNIEDYLPRMRCPILAMQGTDDEYGTFEQIDRIAAKAAAVEICKIPNCRHSPHRDQPEVVIGAAARFIRQL